MMTNMDTESTYMQMVTATRGNGIMIRRKDLVPSLGQRETPTRENGRMMSDTARDATRIQHLV